MLRRLRRSRVVTVVLVGVTALVVGAGGVYWFGLRDDAAAVQTPEVTSQAVAASLTTLFSSVVRLAATAWLVTSGVWTAAASSRSPNQYTPPAPTTRAVTPTRTTVTTRLRLSLRSMRTLTHFDQELQDQPGRP